MCHKLQRQSVKVPVFFFSIILIAAVIVLAVHRQNTKPASVEQASSRPIKILFAESSDMVMCMTALDLETGRLVKVQKLALEKQQRYIIQEITVDKKDMKGLIRQLSLFENELSSVPPDISWYKGTFGIDVYPSRVEIKWTDRTINVVVPPSKDILRYAPRKSVAAYKKLLETREIYWKDVCYRYLELYKKNSPHVRVSIVGNTHPLAQEFEWLLPTNSSQSLKKNLHPVVLPSNESGRGFLIGGTLNEKWLPEDNIAPYMRGNEQYKLYSETGFLKKTTGTKPSKQHDEQDYFAVHIPGLQKMTASFTIAVGGNWNAMPRKAVALRAIPKDCTKAVRAILVQKELGNAPVNITQALQVDLEGDGVNEIIITAISPDFDRYTYRKGQYSLVMLRKMVNGRPKTFLLSREFHFESSENRYPEVDGITGLWDIDGDGALEIFLHQLHMRAEVMRGNVYKMRNGEPYSIYSYAVNFG